MRSSYVTNKNYIRKLTGMAKLTENEQQYIRESFKNSIDIKEISEVSGINKSTLLSWVRKGLI
jgi:DNA-directed RNA polymerase specialized sigma subunit